MSGAIFGNRITTLPIQSTTTNWTTCKLQVPKNGIIIEPTTGAQTICQHQEYPIVQCFGMNHNRIECYCRLPVLSNVIDIP